MTRQKSPSIPMPEHNPGALADEQKINALDVDIFNLLKSLTDAGLDMRLWEREYVNLPDDPDTFTDFHTRLTAFNQRRSDALATIEFMEEMDDYERAQVRRFDQEVRNAFKEHDHFLGNGATAEVYGMSGNSTLCVKFITNQERYSENNHIRKEYDLLSRVYEHTKAERVRPPYPVFLRVHPKEGHSYGMEKVQGASLSQLLEFPEKYPELLELVVRADRAQLEADLLEFVDNMHEAGVAHGDLFKRNIMLDKTGRLFVIDFGKGEIISFVTDGDERMKADRYLAKQQLHEFFLKIDNLTN